MKYKNLGCVGVKVFFLCFGIMIFGDGVDEQILVMFYGMCRDKGINFFDCVNVYVKGEFECIFG